MHLIYFDESGNTGNNLKDSEQPIFVLGALIVPSLCWQKLEQDLNDAFKTRFPDLPIHSEIHASDLRRGSGVFKNATIAERVALRDAWMEIAIQHDLKFAYRRIVKEQYQKWMVQELGSGISINPHLVAFPLLSIVVNEYLTKTDSLGMFISDENKEIVHDVEKSLHHLRFVSSPLKMTRIIEKGFFIDSSKSRVLQLCDLCVLNARKMEEAIRIGTNPKSIDIQGIRLLEPLIMSGDERFADVLEWVKRELQNVCDK